MLEEQRIEAQRVLYDLFCEHLLPFELNAYRVECAGGEEYTVRFHDSRLRSVDVSWREGQSFEDIFRAAVLEEVTRLNGH